jgi:membrane-bound lytic murein transglycosylase B
VRAALSVLTFAVAASLHAQQAFDPARPEIAAFITDVASRHEMEPAELAGVLAQAQSQPAILQAISKPAERALSWDEYRSKFLIERRIQRGAETYAIRRTALDHAAAASGVPVDILLGIVGVETFYGDNTGKYRVVDALATLAFDYPPRSPYFTQELEQYLLMAREEKLDPLNPRGSYAGAMGVPQFMPTSFRRFAVDGDGDGTRDLWNDWADVFASVGNYLQEHGWRAGEPVMTAADVTGAKLDGLDMTSLAMKDTVGSLRQRGIRFQTSLSDDTPATLVPLAVGFGTEYRVGFANFLAITRYNRSLMYASAVSDLADAIATARAALPAPPNTSAVASATP